MQEVRPEERTRGGGRQDPPQEPDRVPEERTVRGELRSGAGEDRQDLREVAGRHGPHRPDQRPRCRSHARRRRAGSPERERLGAIGRRPESKARHVRK